MIFFRPLLHYQWEVNDPLSCDSQPDSAIRVSCQSFRYSERLFIRSPSSFVLDKISRRFVIIKDGFPATINVWFDVKYLDAVHLCGLSGVYFLLNDLCRSCCLITVSFFTSQLIRRTLCVRISSGFISAVLSTNLQLLTDQSCPARTMLLAEKDIIAK